VKRGSAELWHSDASALEGIRSALNSVLAEWGRSVGELRRGKGASAYTSTAPT